MAPEEQLVLQQDEYWLWPENEEPFVLWLSLQTQWAVGIQGPVGLNYQGVEACMRMRGVKPKDRQRLFSLVQMMEQAALSGWAQQH